MWNNSLLPSCGSTRAVEEVQLMAEKVMQGSSCCGTHVQVTHLCFGAQTKVEMAGEDSSNKRLNGFRHEELFMQERLSRLALLRDSKNREIEFSEKQM